MAVKQLSAIIRKNLSIILAALVLSCPLPLAAQFQGYFAQQTLAVSTSGTMTASATHTSVNNLGQAAHSITVNSGGCEVTLDASTDGTNWFVIAAITSTSRATAYAQGYFPLLRLTFNFEANAACSGSSYSVQYVGYQNPIPAVTPSVAAQVYNSGGGGYTTAANLFSDAATAHIWQLTHFACQNPNASVAYVQIIDDINSAASLGLNVLYQAPIPANGLFIYDGPILVGVRSLAIGASTAALGNTAVGTGVTCTAQASETVSFLTGGIPSP